MPKRRINAAAKGARLERDARAILEECGYSVHRCVRSSRAGISLSNDVFGLFDLVAQRRDVTPRYIQVTTKHDRTTRMRKINPWALKYSADTCRVEVWAAAGGGAFDSWIYNWRRNLWECGTKTYDARKPLPVRGAA